MASELYNPLVLGIDIANYYVVGVESILTADAVDHARVRKLFSPAFSEHVRADGLHNLRQHQVVRFEAHARSYESFVRVGCTGILEEQRKQWDW